MKLKDYLVALILTLTVTLCVTLQAQNSAKTITDLSSKIDGLKGQFQTSQKDITVRVDNSVLLDRLEQLTRENEVLRQETVSQAHQLEIFDGRNEEMGNSMIKVPFEPTEKFYQWLQDELKLSAKKAFKIIYYLQEDFKWEDEDGHHEGILPDVYEKCRAKGCGTLYDSDSEGCIARRCDWHMCNKDTVCEDCRKYKQLG